MSFTKTKAFKKNPVKGGMPPSLRSEQQKEVAMPMLSVVSVFALFTFVRWSWFSTKVTGIRRIEYVRR